MSRAHRKLISAVTLTAMFAAVPAVADETFDSFQNFCVATNGDNAKTIAAADQAGWMPLPQTLLDQMMAAQPKNKEEINGVQARMHSSSKTIGILLLADASSMISNFKGHMCFVGAAPPSAADFDAAVATFAGVPAEGSFDGGFTAYIWHVVDGHHVQVRRGDPDIKNLFESGQITFIVTKRDEKIAGIGLVVSPTANAATASSNTNPSDAK
jgi:hypothetical protein